MSEIDKKRIAAVTMLEEMGYRFAGGVWMLGEDGSWPLGVQLMAQLAKRYAALEAYEEGTPEAVECEAIGCAIDAFQEKWWLKQKDDLRNLPWEEEDEDDRD